eukprot:TRINITY_DN581_c0_g1_i1.p1 TRINITY_DN581_c0_g1~~TRINITY_DN581_c0_g1_i1.p1  ORF type:complete len:686 (-),score=219.84 TRINITY_DN581_c0_g1_i1:116-1963(-)
MKVNKLSSVKTQLPYDYYDALPFCRPRHIKDVKENLGEILKGDRVANSVYKMNILKDEECKVAGADLNHTLESQQIDWWHSADNKAGAQRPTTCSHFYTKKELDKFAKFIKDEYRVHWELDDMPAAQKKLYKTGDVQEYDIGYLLGSYDEASGIARLNNHVTMIIKYIADNSYGQDTTKLGYRIVGFEVKPESYDYQNAPDCKSSLALQIAPLAGAEGKEIHWTYSVVWEEDTISWYERWDRYFASVDKQIHWFSIINSLLIVLFLTGMVAMIMIRTLHADFRKYSSKEVESEAEETGWKLLHADVFRPPAHRLLLSVFVGFGAQVFAMVFISLAFALLGFLSPANRGSLLSGMLVLFVLMGVVSGYNAVRMYKMFKGYRWVLASLLTALLIPGIIFGIFMIVDFFIMGVKSSRSVPFTTFLSLVALWFGVSLPLVLLGGYIGFKKPAIQNPGTERNTIPRFIPPQVWYMHPAVNVLMGGVLPFGAVFIELFFVLGAVWGQQMYYIFTFLFIVFFILVVTCAEITIVMCYFQLCSEDYHWWWRAFMTSGSSALYMFAYSAFYFGTKLDITKFVSGLLYFGYTAIFSIVFFVLTGYIGFYACFLFVRKIYASVPLD